MVQAILLSAGLSRRFGAKNKLLYQFNEHVLFVHTLLNMYEAGLGPLIVVTGHDRKKILNAIPRTVEFTEVYNPNYTQGMTSSIQSAVSACSDSVSGYMICLADQKEIKAQTYKSLSVRFIEVQENDSKSILLPKYKNSIGNPAVISSNYKSDILALSFTNGCKPIVKENKNHVHYCDVDDPGILKDIDTQEDLA